MMRRLLAPLAAALVIGSVLAPRVSTQASAARLAPVFEVVPGWFNIPNNWVMGTVTAVAVDREDNVWVMHRPGTGVPEDKKDRVAPPVVQYDSSGKFIRGWGGPSAEYDWPGREHAMYVDSKDHVWIAGTSRSAKGPGTGKSDDMILEFTNTGKLVRQIGQSGKSGGAKDTKNIYGAADLFVYQKTNELFAGDEGNLRVIVFDTETGAFKRTWSAFGKPPVDRPPAAPAAPGAAQQPPPPLETEGPGPDQFSETHSVRVSNDGFVYVADRPNRRIQVFTIDGKYVTQMFVNRGGPARVSGVGIEFSKDPDQRFMYVADSGNDRLVVVERKTLEVLYQFGSKGTAPGQFQGIHYLAVDSKGNLYTEEVETGNRVQKFLFKGLASPPAQ